MSTLQKKIVCALNNKMYVAGIPCNLAKTFHCVSKYYAHETYVFMEFRVQQVNGLNHIFMIERKKQEKFTTFKLFKMLTMEVTKYRFPWGLILGSPCSFIYVYISIYMMYFFQFKPTSVTLMILILFQYYYFTSTDRSKIAFMVSSVTLKMV